MDKRSSRYFCDYCNKTEVNEKEEVTKVYFSCYQKTDWLRHISNKRHIKNKEKCTKLSEYQCKFCFNYFDKDGYNNHMKVNKQFHEKWELYENKEYTCNNFIINEQRASDFSDWKTKAMLNKKIKTGYTPKEIRTNTKNHIKSIIENKKVYVSDPVKSLVTSPIFKDNSAYNYHYKPVDFCNDPCCLLPIYENLNAEIKFVMEGRGNQWCKCDEYDSEYDSEDIQVTNQVTNQVINKVI
tara:strand:- start:23 stop:739 length:717 start_codon:yes stop_codon:yes gene_type:complete